MSQKKIEKIATKKKITTRETQSSTAMGASSSSSLLPG
jgi:hypothetical protein